MILSRAMSAGPTWRGRRSFSWHTPSIRLRITNSFSHGSRWMSEAPLKYPSSIMRLASWMIGAESSLTASAAEVEPGAKLGADLLDDIGEAGHQACSRRKTRWRRVRFARQQADDAETGLLLDPGGQRGVEWIGDRADQQVADLAGGKDEVLPAEFLREPLETFPGRPGGSPGRTAREPVRPGAGGENRRTARGRRSRGAGGRARHRSGRRGAPRGLRVAPASDDPSGRVRRRSVIGFFPEAWCGESGRGSGRRSARAAAFFSSWSARSTPAFVPPYQMIGPSSCFAQYARTLALSP